MVLTMSHSPAYLPYPSLSCVSPSKISGMRPRMREENSGLFEPEASFRNFPKTTEQTVKNFSLGVHSFGHFSCAFKKSDRGKGQRPFRLRLS
jgi:hypothetical protein